MGLTHWTLNAIDTPLVGGPTRPAGTFPAGYMRDSCKEWRTMCLAPTSLEDVEDLYIFRTLMTGSLLIGLGVALIYQKVKKTEAALLGPLRLPVVTERLGRAVGSQDWTIMDIDRRLGNNMERLRALQGAGQNQRITEYSEDWMDWRTPREAITPRHLKECI